MPIIEAHDLRKTYQARDHAVHALAGLSLEVPEGTVTGLLGPNGAGKTTAVKVLTTLIRPDSGTAKVAGLDVLTQAREVKRVIGSSGQYAAVDENLTGLENLEMVGRLYHLGTQEARSRARELIELFDLSEAGNRPVKGFSGGMRRRIDLAGALVINPKVLFLDEPTTGLDPRSRIALWAVIKSLVAGGTTVLLTTQYLEEADHLADSISVIDQGRVIAHGTADELKAQIGGHRIALALVDAADAAVARDILARHGAGPVTVDDSGRSLEVPVQRGPSTLATALAELGQAGVELHDAGIRRPTLDDVFLTLTGHPAEAVGDPDTPDASATSGSSGSSGSSGTSRISDMDGAAS